MQIISLENWEHFTELEKVFYEKTTYEYLLGYMAMNNIPNTNGYFSEYQEIIKRYYILCDKLKKEIIIPNVANLNATWEVNFSEKYVEIRTEAN